VHQTRKWRILSERLFDISEGLNCEKLALDRWRRRFDIRKREHPSYMEVLFGRQGSRDITRILANIDVITRGIHEEIEGLVGGALRAASRGGGFDPEDCLRRIRQNTSWSKKFSYSALGKADDLKRRLDRLREKVGVLERNSDAYTDREYPNYFAGTRRMAGPRRVHRVEDAKSLQKQLDKSIAAQQDAQLLHRSAGQSKRLHIGLSVPQIDDRDFNFLLNMEGRSQELVVHPINFKKIHDRSRVKSDLTATLPVFRSNPNDEQYVQPSLTSPAGFTISLPTANRLVDLEHKDSLATIINNRDTYLGSQILYSQDKSGIASGIAQGSLRLIGSQWLSFLDCRNVRWRRTKDGHWISMLTAAPGNASTTKTLNQCYTTNQTRRDVRDLTKHIQIFRIGLVLAELALKTPISYVDFDPSSYTVKLYNDDAAEIDIEGLAEAVKLESNELLANMVFKCLNVLQDKEHMSDRAIERYYLEKVLSDAKELDGLLREGRKR
jgi:hypothetical protein